MFHEYMILHLASFVIPATLFMIIALALNLQFGHTGLFNAGLAAFVAVGAYTFGLLTTGFLPESTTHPGHWGPATPMDLIPAALLAMMASALLGVLVAIPVLRLRADYLAIATLALAETVRLVIKEELHLTGGDQTLHGIPRPFGGLIGSTEGWLADGIFMVVAGAVAIIVLIALLRIGRLPWGRALRAVREDEDAAMALGRDAFRLKLTAFGIGCGIMGLGGALYASFSRVILPDQFGAFFTFNAYVIVILGGTGNHRGVVLGSFLFWLFTWATQNAKTYLPDVVGLRLDFITLVAVGLLFVAVILYMPEGIIPEEKYVPATGAS
jgi:branched-chain amino acid transport system permease protein